MPRATDEGVAAEFDSVAVLVRNPKLGEIAMNGGLEVV